MSHKIIERQSEFNFHKAKTSIVGMKLQMTKVKDAKRFSQVSVSDSLFDHDESLKLVKVLM